MQAQKTKSKWGVIIIGALILAIAGLIVWGVTHRSEKIETLPTAPPLPTPEVVIREKEVERVVEVEKEITAEILTDGLRDMGLLVTEEYAFTEVVSFSSIKKIFNVEVGITESSYLAGYDGIVTAGIDFSSVQVEKDEPAGRITVTLPAAQITGVDIDPESFVLYAEKIRPWNPISAEDFNASLVELEAKAREKALERGVLTRADANARQIVCNFITGLVGSEGYSIEIKTA